MIYLSAAYHYHRERRPFAVRVADSGVAIGTWALILAGVVFAALPIWV